MEATNDTAKKKPGRPPGSGKPPEQQQSEFIRMRATPAEHEKYKQLGGSEWLRGVLKRARVTA
jgi:hypothetical protein